MTLFKTFITTILMSFALVLPACSDVAPSADLYPNVASDDVVLSIGNSGGCDWGGQCQSYTVTRSGHIDVSVMNRTTGESEIIKTWKIPPEKIETWLARVEDTNFKQLYQSFDKGGCRGCSDGIDVSMMILPGKGDYSVNTMAYTFDREDNVFQAALVMLREVETAEYQERTPAKK